MCTPTQDQVIQKVRERLDAANQWVLQHTLHHKDTLWTGPVKTALCNACHAAWGACSPIWVCATHIGHCDPNEWSYDPTRRRLQDRFVCIEPPNPNRAAHQGEWLYDVTCLRYEQPWPTQQKVLLVAEVEWGSNGSASQKRAAVLEDFAKLLVVCHV